MLQHVELGGLFLPFCHARNGNGISDRWYRSLSCPTTVDERPSRQQHPPHSGRVGAGSDCIRLQKERSMQSTSQHPGAIEDVCGRL